MRSPVQYVAWPFLPTHETAANLFHRPEVRDRVARSLRTSSNDECEVFVTASSLYPTRRRLACRTVQARTGQNSTVCPLRTSGCTGPTPLCPIFASTAAGTLHASYALHGCEATMATDDTVTFYVTPPARFERPQVALRVVAVLILAVLGDTLGWYFFSLYVLLPLVAAILVARSSPERFLQKEAPRLVRLLHWFLAVLAYLLFLTDRFPSRAPDPAVHFTVHPTGRPTVGSCLLRLITGIPHALLFLLLSVMSAFLWLVSVVMVLVTERYPSGIYNFQCAIVGWLARFLAWHLSLVEPYPPFALDLRPQPLPAHKSS